ncbi:related to alpha glucosidase II beta subunit [Cephalotrichum gorgonifer]|uniref:Glucosidase 2 subunit beta n=1 Tax=Cephalotrichum gorgonifer TaxID=2041049 RepID=A0AAE8N732_9PEZI|nr:related to alpha glucosidase II beta subunit [Cephalotrichum gorgonifer]
MPLLGLCHEVLAQIAKYYESKDTFTCISNPSIKIDAAKVNDDSCDCPDGSDEPGTSACANLSPLSPPQPLPGSPSGTTNTSNALPGFWCANKGHIGAYVPFTLVNDGVCDYDLCCDGSEEYSGAGGVKCPNKCAEIGKEWRRVAEQKQKALEKSGAKRNELIRQAKQARRNVETNIVNLRNEVVALEAKRVTLQNKFDEVERLERRKVNRVGASGGKLAELLDLSKNRVDELRETLELVVKQRDEARGKIAELEGILKRFKEEYNPNFNDEGVKQAAKSWENYAARIAGELPPIIDDKEIQDVLVEDDEENGINWKDFEATEEAADADIIYAFEAYLPKFVIDLYYKQLTLLRKWLVDNGMLADTKDGAKESKALASARDALQAAEREISSKKGTLKSEEEDLDKDYGPDDIFRALKGQCIAKDSGEYTYELCWFQKTSQKSKKGHGNTNMGDFARIDREMSDEEERHDGKGLGSGERMVLRYENGQSCWNGPRRRTDVWLACAEKEEIWRVSESEKCVYKMEVGTPAACEPAPAAHGSGGKDEL